ncbi:MAG TPA: dienelactone hydrolase family protein [Dehalococcoidia bacterium]|nr:dienelactone hydrolase family protein [Dehalococcoidia bacterium]
MQLNHHQRYLVEEFAEEYLERRMSRRDMMRRVLAVTGSVTGAAAVLVTLGCGSSDDGASLASTSTAAPAQPTAAATSASEASGVQHVAADDPAITASDVRYPGPTEMRGYLARPKAEGKYAGLIIIHENRGLLEHFKDVSRRYAKEGFVALAVDLASRKGGSTDDAVSNMSKLTTDPIEMQADLKAGVEYLKAQAFVRPGSLGVTGFCFGGGATWELAVASPDVKAAVPYYGSCRPKDQLAQTNAAVLAIYGGNDTRITGESADVEQRLRAANKTVQIKVYPGANHAFFNDTGSAYNAEAAADAWRLTLDWFRRYLTA